MRSNASDGFPLAAKNPFQQWIVFDVIRFELDQEDAGQITHFGRMEKKRLHENFNGTAPVGVLVPHGRPLAPACRR